jgi:hypothetical protein
MARGDCCASTVTIPQSAPIDSQQVMLATVVRIWRSSTRLRLLSGLLLVKLVNNVSSTPLNFYRSRDVSYCGNRLRSIA